MPFNSNYSQWRQSILGQQRNVKALIQDAVSTVANETVEIIKSRIPPGATNSAFPGYAATGSLKSAFVADPPREISGGYAARVGLSRTASDLNTKKAYVHEYGMTIHARTKPYLHFKIGNAWIKTKQVRIRQKRFFRSGWDEARAKFPQFITASIGRGLYK
jgi:hypothetical protein